MADVSDMYAGHWGWHVPLAGDGDARGPRAGCNGAGLAAPLRPSADAATPPREAGAPSAEAWSYRSPARTASPFSAYLIDGGRASPPSASPWACAAGASRILVGAGSGGSPPLTPPEHAPPASKVAIAPVCWPRDASSEALRAPRAGPFKEYLIAQPRSAGASPQRPEAVGAEVGNGSAARAAAPLRSWGADAAAELAVASPLPRGLDAAASSSSGGPRPCVAGRVLGRLCDGASQDRLRACLSSWSRVAALRSGRAQTPILLNIPFQAWLARIRARRRSGAAVARLSAMLGRLERAALLGECFLRWRSAKAESKAVQVFIMRERLERADAECCALRGQEASLLEEVRHWRAQSEAALAERDARMSAEAELLRRSGDEFSRLRALEAELADLQAQAMPATAWSAPPPSVVRPPCVVRPPAKRPLAADAALARVEATGRQLLLRLCFSEWCSRADLARLGAVVMEQTYTSEAAWHCVRALLGWRCSVDRAKLRAVATRALCSAVQRHLVDVDCCVMLHGWREVVLRRAGDASRSPMLSSRSAPCASAPCVGGCRASSSGPYILRQVAERAPPPRLTPPAALAGAANLAGAPPLDGVAAPCARRPSERLQVPAQRGVAPAPAATAFPWPTVLPLAQQRLTPRRVGAPGPGPPHLDGTASARRPHSQPVSPGARSRVVVHCGRARLPASGGGPQQERL